LRFVVLLVSLLILDRAIWANTPVSCPSKQWQVFGTNPGLPSCPGEKGRAILPVLYPVATIHVGFYPEQEHIDFIEKIVRIAEKQEVRPIVNLIVSANDYQIAYKSLRKYRKGIYQGFVVFTPIPGDYAIWVQDYFESVIDFSSGENFFLDFPHHEESGDGVVAPLSFTCRQDVVSLAAKKGARYDVTSSDYAGNVEAFPGGVLVVGKNMREEFRKNLSRTLVQTLFEVDIQWTQNGHVDEVFSVIPAEKHGRKHLLLLYASPKLALETLKKYGYIQGRDTMLRITNTLYLDIELDTLKEAMGCFASLKAKSHQLEDFACKELVRANHVYDDVLAQNRRKLVRILKERNPNYIIKEIAMPQLFLPEGLRKKYGVNNDGAALVNPSPVNVVVIGKDVVIQKQHYLPFQKHIEEVLSGYDLVLNYVKADLLYTLNGGPHCAVNTVRACRPKAQKRKRQKH
jgi:hypothetical protein